MHGKKAKEEQMEILRQQLFLIIAVLFFMQIWQFSIMLSGTCNSPAIFDRYIQAFLVERIYLFYIDNVIIFREKPEEYIEYLLIVFQKLREAGFEFPCGTFWERSSILKPRCGSKTNTGRIEVV